MNLFRVTLLVVLLPLGFMAPALAEEKKPSLIYYYFDGWVLCDKITVIVNDQSKQHGKKVEISACKVGEGNSKEDIKSAKLASHGIVARDKDGKLVAAVEGHNYGKAKVVEVVSKLLKVK